MKHRWSRSILTVFACLMCLLTENGLAATGTVKWFNTEKGFGFITPDNAGADVLVHVTGLTDANRSLVKGQSVEYDLTLQAINVKTR